jgi:hypothetical protein
MMEEEGRSVAQAQRRTEVRPGWRVTITGPHGEYLRLGLREPEDLALARRWIDRIEVEAQPLPTVWTVPKSKPCFGCGSTARGLHVRGCRDQGILQEEFKPPCELPEGDR